MENRSLNVDFASRISELEAILKKLPIKWVIYEAIFKGKGLEFEGYREYSTGDDAEMIDWMASARSQKTLVKKYLEERDLSIMFLIDVHDGMIFGSEEKLKCECAAEMVAALAHLIVTSGDKVGFSLVREGDLEIFLPEKGMKRFNVLAEHLSLAKNYGGKPPEMDKTLNFFMDRLNKSISTVFVVSDFISCGKDFEKVTNYFSKKFEMIPLIVRDELDEKLPLLNAEIIIENPSKPGQQVIINPSVAKKSYEKNSRDKKEKLIKTFEECGVEYLEIKTSSNLIEELVNFLKMRTKYKKTIIPKR